MEAYTEVFTRLGAQHLSVVNPRTAPTPTTRGGRAHRAGHRDLHERREPAQAEPAPPRHPLGDAIHRAHDRGAVVGGTSAGASIMSEFMISMGDEGITPASGPASSAPASASSGRHHRPALRPAGPLRPAHVHGRGLPNLIGIGIDEDTAIEVVDRRTFTVHGRGAVFVLDCRAADSDAPEAGGVLR